MICHIFKIIWNERKTNLLIVVQYILVFGILWFCFDYLYYIGNQASESHGLDIDHTYYITMKERKSSGISADEKYEFARTFIDRVSKYPGIEAVSFSEVAVPYGFWNQKGQYHLNGDSLWHNMDVKKVTPDFFDVFKIKIDQGRIFNPDDASSRNEILISPDKDYHFGNKGASYPVDEVKIMQLREEQYTIIGITERQKPWYFVPYFNSAYFCMQREDMDLAANEIAIRISPSADRNFAEKFRKDMKKQLRIGPYYLSSVIPFSEMQKMHSDYLIRDNINNVAAISIFLFLNIFLCLVGTFWFRTQARRSEVGLRIALGSSKRQVRLMLYAEALLLLFLGSIPATYVCLNLGTTDLLSSLGIPTANRIAAGIGKVQDVINYLFTFLFLALVSFMAISYPARQSSNIAPADALRDE